MAGFPLLAGFWSKDEIVHHAFMQHPVLGIVGLLTAALTALYTFRMIFLAFWGEQRVPEGVSAHESGKWMLVPLCVLALGAVFAGYAGVHVHGGGFLGFLEPEGAFHRFLEPVAAPFAVMHVEEHAAAPHGFVAAVAHHWLLYVSALVAVGGIIVAYVFFVSRPWLPLLLRYSLANAHQTLYDKYYVDEAYDKVIVRPLRQSGVFCYRIDEFFIDGIIWLITAVPRLIGFVGRSLQTGVVQSYGLSMAAGLAVIVVLVLLA